MRSGRFFLFGITSLLFLQGAFAQVSVQQVDKALASFQYPKVNTVLVRDFYSGKELHFNDTGIVVEPHPGIWTVDGWIRVKKITVENGSLWIRGERLLMVFPDGKPTVIEEGKRDVALVFPVPADDAALQKMFSSAFCSASEPFTGTLPEMWRQYFEKPPIPKPDPHRSDKPPSMREVDGVQVYTFGKGVKPPRGLSTPDPSYDPSAKNIKLQGTVVLWAIIEPDGKADHIRLQRPLGAGLDEKALAAVQSWRFEPARYQGKAVPMQVNIEMNFRLF